MNRQRPALACSSRLACAFAFAIAACSGGDTSPSEDEEAAAREEFSPVPDVPGTGVQPGSHRLAEVGVVVRKNKKNGNPWDEPSPEPDPRIEVSIAGKRVAVCENDNTYEARCELDKTVQLGSEATIEFRVIDSDISDDDRIGEARLADLTRRGARDTRLPMQVKGQLREAYFRLARPLTWWDRYRKRIIGAAVGLLAGLLLWFTFETFWLRRRPEEDPEEDNDEEYDDDGEEYEDEPAGDVNRRTAAATRESAGESVAPARNAGAEKIYRVRCDSCGAMSTTARDTCAYCGESLLEEKARS